MATDAAAAADSSDSEAAFPPSSAAALSVISPQAMASSLLSLISSSPDPIVFVESSDHTLLALPLPIARRCQAIITKHLHADLTAHGTALFTTVTGEAMVRCVGYVQHEWKEIEKRKEKLAVLMRLRGQKGSERLTAAGGDSEKEGGGRRGKDREKNLLISVQKAQQALVAHFSSVSHLAPSTSAAVSSTPLFPPHALGVTPPSHPIASLLAPSSTIAHLPSLSYSINHILCELASSAYYLEVAPLVDLTCQRLADSIQGKSPEEIRTTFNITNDFTPVEEEQVQQRVMERTLLYPGGIDDGPYRREQRECGGGCGTGRRAGRSQPRLHGRADCGPGRRRGLQGEERQAQGEARAEAPAAAQGEGRGSPCSGDRREEGGGCASQSGGRSGSSCGTAATGGSAGKKKKKKKAKKKGKAAEEEEKDGGKDGERRDRSRACLHHCC